MDAPRIGFIGLGKMGAGMVGRLLEAGFSLTAFDVRTEAVDAVVKRGADAADSVKATVSGADIVCLSLPGPHEAEQVLFGEEGLLRHLPHGAVCIDFTTNAPSLVRRAAEQCQRQGAEMIDAPVSGGVEGARAGNLTVLAGGSSAAIERCRPVFHAVAATVLHVGPAGAASVCKVLHNCAVFCTNFAMIECLTAGVKAGVPAATLIEVFQKSGLGRNLDLQVSLPATLFRDNFEPRFQMNTALKDMRLATDLACEVGAPLELAVICERDMAEAVDRGWGARDNTVFLTLREQRVGAKVRTQ